MKKLTRFFILLMVLTLCAVPSFGENEKEEPIKLVGIINQMPTYEKADPAVLQEIHDKILEELNIDLEMILGPSSGGELVTKVNMMLAGNEHLDFARIANWNQLQMNGALLDITEEMNEYGKHIAERWTDKGMRTVTDKEGRIWAIPQNMDHTHYPIFVRQDWCEKLGLELPKTMEELENVLKTFKEKDPAGNGKTVPFLTNLNHSRYTLAGAFIENGWGEFKGEDGRIYPPYMDEHYVDFISKLHDWYAAGYMPKDVFSYKTSNQADIIKSDRLGVSGLWYSRITMYEGDLQEINPDAHYEMCPITGPAGIAETVNAYNKLPASSSKGAVSVVVFKGCQHPEAVVKLLDWGYTDDNFLVADYGPNGYELVQKATETTPYMYKVNQELYSDVYSSMLLGWANEHLFQNVGVAFRLRHIDYLVNHLTSYDRAKMPFDAEVAYSLGDMLENVEHYADIERAVDEYALKFITGEKPMEEFGDFYKKLEELDVEELIDEITRQYNEWHE